MIGHLSGMELATRRRPPDLRLGVLRPGDVPMFWIGSFWREDDQRRRPTAGRSAHCAAMARRRSARRHGADARRRRGAGRAVAGLCRALTMRPSQSAAGAAGERAVGWPQAAPFTGWTPRLRGPGRDLSATLTATDATAPVALDIVYYRNQRNGKALISSINCWLPRRRLAMRSAARRASRRSTASRSRCARPGCAVRGGQFAGVAMDARSTAIDREQLPRQAAAGPGQAALPRRRRRRRSCCRRPSTSDPDAARAALRAFLTRQCCRRSSAR